MWPLWLVEMSLPHIQKNSGYRVIRKTKCGAAGAGRTWSSPIHKQASLAGRLIICKSIADIQFFKQKCKFLLTFVFPFPRLCETALGKTTELWSNTSKIQSIQCFCRLQGLEIILESEPKEYWSQHRFKQTLASTCLHMEVIKTVWHVVSGQIGLFPFEKSWKCISVLWDSLICFRKICISVQKNGWPSSLTHPVMFIQMPWVWKVKND